MNDLETQIRGIADRLPEPDAASTHAARAAMLTALAAAPRAHARGRGWFGGRRGRWYLLAGAAGLLVAGGALAAGPWGLSDLPPFGEGDEEAFALPATDILPGGYQRTRPPRYEDLPERPALLFPPGVGYTQALTRYAAARAKGRVLPAGVELTDPLPQGKVVMIRGDRRVALDPAAPFGYSATTGLVNILAFPLTGATLPLARCQVLFGDNDPDSPPCDQPGVVRSYVREGINGRWLPSPNEEELENPDVPASTQLSVLTDASVPQATLPEPLAGMIRRDLSGPGGTVAKRAQTTDGVTLIVAASDDRLCFLATGRDGAGVTCGARNRFLDRGASFSGSQSRDRPYRINGLVGDGVEQVSTDTGTAAPVINNTFTMQPDPAARTLTFTGPVGSFTLPIVVGGEQPNRETPDRSRERELVGITLSSGGRASIRIAPNRGGGRCEWLYIRGQVRSSGCTRPGDPPLQYDVVTAGFTLSGPDAPIVYSGRFAPQVGQVEMHFADGTRQRLPMTDHVVLYEVPPSRLTREREPVAVVTYDRQGVPLVRGQLQGIGANGG